MDVIEIAQCIGREEVLAKIAQAGLMEYGLYPEVLSDKIIRIKEENEKLPAVGALNNHDMDQLLLSVAKEHPKAVLSGLAVEAFLLETQEMQLYIPKEETQLKRQLEAAALELSLDIQIKEGIVDTRKLKGSCISHLETLKAVSDILTGCYVKGTILAVKEVSATKTNLSPPEFVPFGSKLNTIFQLNSKNIKAVKVGTKLYPAAILAEQIQQDTNVGNGVITIYDESCCMLDMAEKELLQSRKTSCGKCTFCREGLIQLFARMHENTSGKGEFNGLEIMKEIGESMRFSSLCSVGEFGAEMVLETLAKFPAEYIDHIKKKKCTAGSCLSFVNVYIDPKRCNSCGACIPACPMDCIEGLPGYIHMIEKMDCTKCEACFSVCETGAIQRTTGSVPKLPDRLTRTGRFKQY